VYGLPCTIYTSECLLWQESHAILLHFVHRLLHFQSIQLYVGRCVVRHVIYEAWERSGHRPKGWPCITVIPYILRPNCTVFTHQHLDVGKIRTSLSMYLKSRTLWRTVCRILCNLVYVLTFINNWQLLHLVYRVNIHFFLFFIKVYWCNICS